MSEPTPTRRSLRATAAPVFVDASGRRRRALRTVAAALVAVAAVYVGLLVSAWLGGPAIDAPFLPRHPNAAAPAVPGPTSSPTPTAAPSSPPATTPRPAPLASAPAVAPVSATTPLPAAAASPRPSATPSPTPTAPGKSATAPGHSGAKGTSRPTPPPHP